MPSTPSVSDQKEWWNFHKSATTRGAEDIRAILHVDEWGFRRVEGYSHANARDYFIYGALDEVQKTGIAIMQWEEFLGPGASAVEVKDETDQNKRLTRIIIGSVLDDQSLRQRKLMEALINLICFDLTNDHDYYRHFLLVGAFERYLSLRKDLEEFYACPNQNVLWSLERTRDWILRLEQSTVDPKKCWYLRSRKPFAEVKPVPGRLFSSIRSRLKQALQDATPSEKLALGLSYEQAFSRASRDVHFMPSAPYFGAGIDDVTTGISHCGLLTLSILIRCQMLTGVVPEGINAQISKAYEANQEPANRLSDLVGRRANVGDFVLAYGDLAEVLEVGKSAFGYESYRVRYLAERPIREIEEEWFVPQHVRILYSKGTWLAAIDRMVEADKLPSDLAARLRSLPPDFQQDALRQTIVEVWNRGLRDYLRQEAVRG